MKSDFCRDCGCYSGAIKYWPYDSCGLAYCGAYRDTIAKDAKTARYCPRWREKYDKPKGGGFRYE